MRKAIFFPVITFLFFFLAGSASAESIREQFAASPNVQRVIPLSDTETLIVPAYQTFTKKITDEFLKDMKAIMDKNGCWMETFRMVEDPLTGNKTKEWSRLKIMADGTFVDPDDGKSKKWDNRYMLNNLNYRMGGPFVIKPLYKWIGTNPMVDIGNVWVPKWVRLTHTEKQPFYYKFNSGRKFDFSRLPPDGELFDGIQELKHTSPIGPDYYVGWEIYVYLEGLCKSVKGTPKYLRLVLEEPAAEEKDVFTKRVMAETKDYNEIYNAINKSASSTKNPFNGNMNAWFYACEGPKRFVARGYMNKEKYLGNSYYLRIIFLNNQDLSRVSYLSLSELEARARAKETSKARGEPSVKDDGQTMSETKRPARKLKKALRW